MQSSFGEPILFSYWIYIELYWNGKCIFERHVIVTRLLPYLKGGVYWMLSSPI